LSFLQATTNFRTTKLYSKPDIKKPTLAGSAKLFYIRSCALEPINFFVPVEHEACQASNSNLTLFPP